MPLHLIRDPLPLLHCLCCNSGCVTWLGPHRLHVCDSGKPPCGLYSLCTACVLKCELEEIQKPRCSLTGRVDPGSWPRALVVLAEAKAGAQIREGSRSSLQIKKLRTDTGWQWSVPRPAFTTQTHQFLTASKTVARVTAEGH